MRAEIIAMGTGGRVDDHGNVTGRQALPEDKRREVMALMDSIYGINRESAEAGISPAAIQKIRRDVLGFGGESGGGEQNGNREEPS